MMARRAADLVRTMGQTHRGHYDLNRAAALGGATRLSLVPTLVTLDHIIPEWVRLDAGNKNPAQANPGGVKIRLLERRTEGRLSRRSQHR